MFKQFFQRSSDAMLSAMPLSIGLATMMFAVWLYMPLLNPLSVHWVLNEGDLFQHYIGWQFFRYEPWGWPPGAIARLATDMHASIVYSDSIPLLALLLKPFSTLLPNLFQYQGPWMLVTFFLNGYFAARLLLQTGCRAILTIPVALLMSTSTLITARGLGMHSHEALTAHWLIFLALEYTLLLHGFQSYSLRRWLTLLSVAVLIHFYLFFMVGVLWSFWWLAQSVDHVRQRRVELTGVTFAPLLHACIPLIVIFCLMFVAGYFLPGRDSAVAGGFGHFSAELLTYFNSASTAWFFGPDFTSMSQWLPGWVPPVTGQYEGMAYVGLGIILLWALALVTGWMQPRRIQASYCRQQIAVAGLAVTCLFIYAMAGRFSLPGISQYLYFDIPFGPIRDYLRSSGRMVWPLAYALTLWAAVSVSVRLKHVRLLSVCGFVMLALQWLDLQPWHERIRDEIQQRAAAENNPSYFTAIHDWQLADQLQQSHGLIAFPAEHLEKLKPYVWLAAQHQKSINVAYLAGQAADQGVVATRRYIEKANKDRLEPGYIYLITEPALAQRVCAGSGWDCREHDGVMVAWQQ